MAVMMAGSSLNVYAAENVNESYEINDVETLKEYLREYNEDGKITVVEKHKLSKETKPEVEMAFVTEKVEKGLQELEKVEMQLFETSDGNYYGEYTLDLGDGCRMIVEVEDVEDVSPVEELAQNIRSAISPVAYANTKTTQVTHEYGNRSLRAAFNVICGLGTARIKLDNYYNLSSAGIKERYGIAYCGSISLMGTIEHGDPVITDAQATTPGASDAEMYCQYEVYDTVENILNASATFTITSRLIYDSIDKTNGTITLTHEYTKIK